MELPEEDGVAVRKRQAIQSVMQDRSLTALERNEMIQLIMRGELGGGDEGRRSPSGGVPTYMAQAAASAQDRARAEETPPATPSSSVAGTGPAPPTPTRELLMKQRSAQEMIAKFKAGPVAPPSPKPAFSTIDSVQRGTGLEEVDKSAHLGEQKARKAFIPRGSFQGSRQRLEELVQSSSSGRNNANVALGAEPSGGPASDFEERLRMKSRRNLAEAGPGAGDFEARLAEKKSSGGRSRSRSASRERGAKSALDDLERRVVEKAAANDRAAEPSAAGSAAAVATSAEGFEARLARKSSAGASAAVASAAASGGTDDFEARLARKSRTRSRSRSKSRDRSAKSALDDLERRVLEKAAADATVTGRGAAEFGQGKDEVKDEAIDGSEGDAARKRQLIQETMQDPDLSPQERNRRLQSIMGGTWTQKSSVFGKLNRGNSDANLLGPDSGVKKSLRTEALLEKLNRKDDDDGDDEGDGKNGGKRDSWSWDGDDRNVRGSVVTEESRRESGMTTEDSGGDDNAANRRGSLATEGSVEDAAPADRRGSLVTEGSLDDDSNLYRPAGGRLGRSPSPDLGVGYGSLPHPEEHFARSPLDRDGALSPLEAREEEARPLQASSEDGIGQNPNHDHATGLAVATAVADDDQGPDFVYAAIEYDPDAKPPLHRNRRFRAYAFLALMLIGIMVVLVVVYVTSKTQEPQVVDLLIDWEGAPTAKPTASPTTNREASGIIEQIEGGVLHIRGERFVEMDRFDPRRMALDWILHKDLMMLESDSVNLYQRYALAVMAYGFDSVAWYVCGDPGVNYTDDACYLSHPYRENETVSHGVWLSSTSECTWYGVTCSADGVVRAVDLVNNDLIGTIPHEIYAMSSLQFLALPHNCIYGTIPPEIGKIKHLLSLELHGNGLSGEMPREMYDLDDLQLLNLGDQWGGYRECNTTDGRTIDIQYKFGGQTAPLEEGHGLTGTLGASIGVWRSMKGLYLHKNSFYGEISEQIGNMRYLRFLWLYDNYIAGSLPSTITRLKNLRHLLLGENFLKSSLPSDLGKLEDLERLGVNGNSMFGEIPSGLYDLTEMQVLRLDDTLMNEAPWLVVPDEGLTGSISTLMGNMTDLRWLLLSNNPMSGTIPTELGLCEKLEVLRVHRTNISGTMPHEICQLRDKNLNSETGQGVLYADCRPNNRTGDPFLKCDCCSDCCDHTTGVCIADD